MDISRQGTQNSLYSLQKSTQSANSRQFLFTGAHPSAAAATATTATAAAAVGRELFATSQQSQGTLQHQLQQVHLSKPPASGPTHAFQPQTPNAPFHVSTHASSAFSTSLSGNHAPNVNPAGLTGSSGSSSHIVSSSTSGVDTNNPNNVIVNGNLTSNSSNITMNTNQHQHHVSGSTPAAMSSNPSGSQRADRESKEKELNGSASGGAGKDKGGTGAGGHHHKEPQGDNKHMSAAERERAKKYKTVPCKNWTALGTCPYGKNCLYAHGEHELRAPPPPEKNYKTVPCRSFKETGRCDYGHKCRYRHDDVVESTTIAETASISRSLTSSPVVSEEASFFPMKLDVAAGWDKSPLLRPASDTDAPSPIPSIASANDAPTSHPSISNLLDGISFPKLPQLPFQLPNLPIIPPPPTHFTTAQLTSHFSSNTATAVSSSAVATAAGAATAAAAASGMPIASPLQAAGSGPTTIMNLMNPSNSTASGVGVGNALGGANAVMGTAPPAITNLDPNKSFPSTSALVLASNSSASDFGHTTTTGTSSRPMTSGLTVVASQPSSHHHHRAESTQMLSANPEQISDEVLYSTSQTASSSTGFYSSSQAAGSAGFEGGSSFSSVNVDVPSYDSFQEEFYYSYYYYSYLYANNTSVPPPGTAKTGRDSYFALFPEILRNVGLGPSTSPVYQVFNHIVDWVLPICETNAVAYVSNYEAMQAEVAAAHALVERDTLDWSLANVVEHAATAATNYHMSLLEGKKRHVSLPLVTPLPLPPPLAHDSLIKAWAAAHALKISPVRALQLVAYVCAKLGNYALNRALEAARAGATHTQDESKEGASETKQVEASPERAQLTPPLSATVPRVKHAGMAPLLTSDSMKPMRAKQFLAKD